MPYGQRRVGPGALAELMVSFDQQLAQCRLRPDERVAVVTDTAFDPHYASAAMGSALRLGSDAFGVELPRRPPWSEDVLRAAFAPADLILYSTTHGLHYSEAMREALAGGKRALMAVVPPHVLERRLANPDLTRRTRAGASRFDRARSVRIHSEAGTELTMDVSGRPGVASYGAADEPGHLDFWGAGFFQVAVREGTMEGRLVLDTGDLIFHFGRYVETPLAITFREGRAVSFEGGVEAKLVRMQLEAAGDDGAFSAGHIAVGTDPRALWTVEASQFPVAGGGGADAEAFCGNVQVELGSNDDVMFGGANRSAAHLGLCCLETSLDVDGDGLVDRGELVPDDLKPPA